jgi:fatty acid desaturase
MEEEMTVNVMPEELDKAKAKKKNMNPIALDVIVTLFCGVGLFLALFFFWDKTLGDAVGRSVVFVILFIIATFCTHLFMPSTGRHVQRKRK